MIIFVTSTKTVFNLSPSGFETNTSLWRKQYVEIKMSDVEMSGFSCFTWEAKPSMEPTTDGALSVQMPTQCLQERPLVFRYEDKILKTSIPLLVSGGSLQDKEFSWISPSLTNLTKAIT